MLIYIISDAWLLGIFVLFDGYTPEYPSPWDTAFTLEIRIPPLATDHPNTASSQTTHPLGVVMREKD